MRGFKRIHKSRCERFQNIQKEDAKSFAERTDSVEALILRQGHSVAAEKSAEFSAGLIIGGGFNRSQEEKLCPRSKLSELFFECVQRLKLVLGHLSMKRNRPRVVLERDADGRLFPHLQITVQLLVDSLDL